MEKPRKTVTVVDLSSREFRLTAEIMPIGIATIKATKSSRTFIVIVTGSLSFILSHTGLPSEYESPKSSFANLATQFAYWTYSGLSRP